MKETDINTLMALDGDCHLCGGTLDEIEVSTPLLHKVNRVICYNCNATADAHTFGVAYIKFGAISG